MSKAWRCPNGHVLGRVVRERTGGRWVTRLALFREAVDAEAEDPAGVDVIAVLEGTVLDVRCSVCGETRTWWAGEAALERLLERMGAPIPGPSPFGGRGQGHG